MLCLVHVCGEVCCVGGVPRCLACVAIRSVLCLACIVVCGVWRVSRVLYGMWHVFSVVWRVSCHVLCAMLCMLGSVSGVVGGVCCGVCCLLRCVCCVTALAWCVM